jgi:hypothetical protein
LRQSTGLQRAGSLAFLGGAPSGKKGEVIGKASGGFLDLDEETFNA